MIWKMKTTRNVTLESSKLSLGIGLLFAVLCRISLSGRTLSSARYMHFEGASLKVYRLLTLNVPSDYIGRNVSYPVRKSRE